MGWLTSKWNPFHQAHKAIDNLVSDYVNLANEIVDIATDPSGYIYDLQIEASPKYNPPKKTGKVIAVTDLVFREMSRNITIGSKSEANLLTKTFDSSSYPDRARLTLKNDRGFNVFITSITLDGKRIMQYSGENGELLHDSLKRDDDIRRNGEKVFEVGNEFIVTAPQVASIADYWYKFLGKKKHMYAVSIPGCAYWYEVGDWYTFQAGAADTNEYIDTTVEVYAVDVEKSAGSIGSTSLLLREVEESWEKTTLYETRVATGGSPKRRVNRSNVITVASADYSGTYDFKCDGTNDEVEIQEALDYASSTMPNGVVELTEGTFNTSTPPVVPSNVNLKSSAYISKGYAGVYAYASRPVIANYNDLVVLYSTATAERGVFVWEGMSWEKDAAPSVAMLSLAWPDIARATVTEAAGGFSGGPFGVPTDYTGTGVDVFAILAAQTAFITQIFTQEVTVGSGGSIRYETGAGVQKRTVQLADEKIDWIDTPDTTPASPEIVQARIGRIGVGPNILLDGEFDAPIESPWSDEKIVNVGAIYYPAYIQLSSGEKRLAYRGSAGYLYERIWDGSAWGSESTINSAISAYPDYVESQSGELRICYVRLSDYYLVERIWNGSAWGGEVVISDTANGSVATPDYIQLQSGELRIAYTRVNGHLVEKKWDGSSWGSETIINDTSTSNLSSDYIQRKSGELRIAYKTISTGYLYERIWNGSAWGPELTINAADSFTPNYVELLNNELRIAYRDSGGLLYERILTGSSWGDQVLITNIATNDPVYIQDVNGSLSIYYQRQADNYLIERTLQRYAQLGAGIIENGSNSNGSYIKYSDGTMQCWQDLPSATSQTWTYPASFIAEPAVLVTNKSGAAGGRFSDTSGVGAASVTVRAWGSGGASTTASHVMAIGRWE